MTDLLLKLQNGAQPTRKLQRIGYIFCIGKNIERNFSYFSRIDQGHGVGNHTQSSNGWKPKPIPI
jgi:hypothetical protein